ncbi:LuxR C-terminal-related transcriptional regulator [Streptomyces sp. NPDC020597]|uniref:helix-turn-helix transcriptional regulator n=1 Tax=unclassified Streptomyces TaxID=2593676 RepID=UPI0037995E61
MHTFFSRSVLSMAAIRRGDLVAAARHIEAAPRAASADQIARYNWLLIQFSAASNGAAPTVSRLAAEQPRLLTDGDLFELEPGAAPWFVRVMLRAGDRKCAEAVVESAGRTSPLGQLHAQSLLDRDAGGLRRAAAEHHDPWASALASEDLGRQLMAGSAGQRTEAESQLRKAAGIYREIGCLSDVERVSGIQRELCSRIEAGVRGESGAQGETGISGGSGARGAAPGFSWASLTETERAVARLVGEGFTNREVAARLFVSPHTVDFHLRRIFQKAGVRSRVRLASVLGG